MQLTHTPFHMAVAGDAEAFIPTMQRIADPSEPMGCLMEEANAYARSIGIKPNIVIIHDYPTGNWVAAVWADESIPADGNHLGIYFALEAWGYSDSEIPSAVYLARRARPAHESAAEMLRSRNEKRRGEDREYDAMMDDQEEYAKWAGRKYGTDERFVIRSLPFDSRGVN